MGATSNNKFEVYEWIKKVINSCQTTTQMVKTNKLIKSFSNLYYDSFLRQCLYNYQDIKWKEIIQKAKKHLKVDVLFNRFLDNSEPDPDVIWNRDQFVNRLLIDDDFYQKWGEDCCEELNEGERYKIWFTNNFETGMEYNPSMTPDYDNEYYEPTPKRKLR